jgi:hypothetical protein
MRTWRCLGPVLIVVAACAKEQPATQGTSMPAGPAPGSTEWKIQNAMSAAPAAIANGAAIMDWPATPEGQPTELRAGTNGWTCFADNAQSPGNDPMCFDGVFGQWAQAWMAHRPVTIRSFGVAYMLQGGSDASNTDPFKMVPDSGHAWVETGPHIMVVVPDVRSLANVPTDHRSGGPYIMWQGTPYAHVMIPVAGGSGM